MTNREILKLVKIHVKHYAQVFAEQAKLAGSEEGRIAFGAAEDGFRELQEILEGDFDPVELVMREEWGLAL